MRNRFDTIVDSIIWHTGIIALGVIFLIITFNLHDRF